MLMLLLLLLHFSQCLTREGVNNGLETLLCQSDLRLALIQILQDLILSTAWIVFTELTNKGHGVTVILVIKIKRRTRE
jgi:hypothetical protein